ncbi:serine dehydratase subunit alpha family protein [Chloroflexota bacterium]
MPLLTDILHEITEVSIGCTEPAAIALATTIAREAIGGVARQVSVTLDPNTFKNALAVTIPNTAGKTSMQLAAALGALCGNSKLGLEIFKDVTLDNTTVAEQMVKLGKIRIAIQRDQPPIFIDAAVKTSAGQGRAIIKGSHTSVAFVEANGKVKIGNETVATETKKELISAACRKLLAMKISDIVYLTASLSPNDKQFLLDGVEMNLTIVRDGLAKRSGLAVGANLQDMVNDGTISDDVINETKILVAGGVDARMSGSSLPVMTNSGSGNQGIASTLPIVVIAKRMKSEKGQIARALAISHLLAAYTKLKIGELSTLCGSAIASAIGASAGILWLTDQREERIEQVVKNIVGNIPGILCDGAHSVCALKLATASGVAVETAFLVSRGTDIGARTGIIADLASETFTNLALISKSLKETELAILDIMTKSDFQSKGSD